jgi:hypothetical protein
MGTLKFFRALKSYQLVETTIDSRTYRAPCAPGHVAIERVNESTAA